MEYRTIQWDRATLYEAVWEKPTVQLAKEYGISDVALAKICKKLNVPKPEPGYWRRKQRGFKVTRPPLPPAKGRTAAVSYIPVDPPAPSGDVQRAIELPLNPPRPTSVRHDAVKQTARAFAKGGNDQFGRIRPSDWRLPKFDLRVTKAGLDRALRFMDELLKLLDANGITVKAGTGHDSSSFCLQVDGELIRIQLKEAVRGRKRDLTPDEQRSHESYPTLYTRDFAFAYDPTNRFSFEIENYSDTNRKWTDTKNQKIEEKTEQIAHALRAVAAFEKRRRTERELERQREEKEQHRRMKQQERIQRLRSNSALWEEAERIRAYLAAVRRRAESEDGGLKEGSLKSRFLAWGHRYADSLDPSGNPAAADWSEEF